MSSMALSLEVVLGHEGAAPATSEALYARVGYLPKNENTLWVITHANKKNFNIITGALGMGACVVRIGFEDSIYLDKETKAETNIVLLEKTVALIKAQFYLLKHRKYLRI